MRKYCITLRNETEWTELVGCGYNHVVGTEPAAILQTVQNLLDVPPVFPIALYGDGYAAEVIAETMRRGGDEAMNRREIGEVNVSLK